MDTPSRNFVQPCCNALANRRTQGGPLMQVDLSEALRSLT
jgi:hypothetical protein